jgi:hypothetical protein
MNHNVKQIKAAGIFPSVEQIDLFSRELLKQQVLQEMESNSIDDYDVESSVSQTKDNIIENKKISMINDDKSLLVGHTRLSMLLKKFVETSQTSGEYFLCEHSDLIRISNWLNSIPLTLTDRSYNHMNIFLVLIILF